MTILDLFNKFQQYMNEYMELYPFSGTIRVVNNGEILLNQAYGKACVEFDVPNSTDTRYSLFQFPSSSQR